MRQEILQQKVQRYRLKGYGIERVRRRRLTKDTEAYATLMKEFELNMNWSEETIKKIANEFDLQCS